MFRLNKNNVFDIVGWVSAAMLLAAFALHSMNVIGLSFTFQGLNLVGAAGIALSSFRVRNYPPAVLNVIWFLIALMAVIHLAIS